MFIHAAARTAHGTIKWPAGGRYTVWQHDSKRCCLTVLTSPCPPPPRFRYSHFEVCAIHDLYIMLYPSATGVL